MNYRVTASRGDVSEHTIAEFTANSDKEAREKFEKEFKNNKNYSWDWLKLVRYTEEIIEMYG